MKIQQFTLDLLILIKPRITLTVVITAGLGWLIGKDTAMPLHHHARELLGLLGAVFLVSSGINALNQYFERDVDALMERTKNRPLPQKRLDLLLACLLGWSFFLSGVGLFWWWFGWQCALFAALIGVLYVGVYTPLKRISALNTLVGAIPGAAPPALGWLAAQGGWGVEGVYLLVFMFVWQESHFLPIAWLSREDYTRANLKMLSVVHPDGKSIRRQQLLYSATLLVLCVHPVWQLTQSNVYYAVIAVTSVLFFAVSGMFCWHLNNLWAKRTLKASVLHLLIVLGSLAYERLSS